jgi:hypothetical protein
MAPDDIVKKILHILSDPSWTGIGVVISSFLSLLAILRSRQSQNNEPRAIGRKKVRLAPLNTNNYPRLLPAVHRKNVKKATDFQIFKFSIWQADLDSLKKMPLELQTIIISLKYLLNSSVFDLKKIFNCRPQTTIKNSVRLNIPLNQNLVLKNKKKYISTKIDVLHIHQQQFIPILILPLAQHFARLSVPA